MKETEGHLRPLVRTCYFLGWSKWTRTLQVGFKWRSKAHWAKAQSTENAILAPLSKQTSGNGNRARNLTKLWQKHTQHQQSRLRHALFFIDAAKKGHLSPDARTHWHHVLCLHHNDLDYSVLDAPCENICLSFQSPNSEANPRRPEPQLIGASLGMVGRTHCHCLTYPGASSPTTCFLQPSRTTGGWRTARTLVFGLQWATSFWFFLNYRVIFRIDYPSEGLGEKFYPG